MPDHRHTEQTIVSDLAILFERFDALDEKLDRIYAQTLKTNGRVTGHDEDIGEIRIELAENRGKSKVSTALWGIAASTFVFLVGFVLNHLLR